MSKPDPKKKRDLNHFLQEAAKSPLTVHSKKIHLVNLVSLETLQKIKDPVIRFKALSSCYPLEMPEDITLFVDYELERIRRDSLEE